MDSNVKKIPAANDTSVPEKVLEQTHICKCVFWLPALLLPVAELCQEKKPAVRICVVPKNGAGPCVTYTNKSSQKQTSVFSIDTYT